MLTPAMLIRIERARQQLADAEAALESIAQVAQDAGLSTFHFIRRFSAVFGDTPHQFRMRVRLDRARELLALGEGSVTEVCMALGFSSLGSFSASFCRRFGEPPSHCRRRLLPSIQMPGRLPPQLVPGCLSLMAAWWRSPQFSRSAEGGAGLTIASSATHRSPP